MIGWCREKEKLSGFKKTWIQLLGSHSNFITYYVMGYVLISLNLSVLICVTGKILFTALGHYLRLAVELVILKASTKRLRT